MSDYRLGFPRSFRIGRDALLQLPDIVRSLEGMRPLIVSDAFLRSSGVADRVAAILRSAGLDAEIYSDVIPDPTTDSLEAAMSALRSHRADVLVAVGGGSPIDSAKAMAVLACYSGEMRELKAPLEYDGPALPVVAVPTTAGTGSEATRFTIIGDSASGEKMLCIGDSYLPAAAIIDYELTMSMPARLTADTGIDALTHAIEAVVSRRANVVSDALAFAAIDLIGNHLRKAFHDPADREAREQMMAAATLAGMAFSNSSVALVHGMSRPLGAHFHIAHGMANAMLLAEVTAFSAPSATARYAMCARAFGVASVADGDVGGSAALVDALRSLARDLSVPTPAECSIGRDEWLDRIPIMTEQALASGSPANNPRVPTASELRELYLAIYE